MVNANSVIPIWLNTFNPAFYTAITNQEDWSYTNVGVSAWQPLFQQLANALSAYKTFDRSAEVQNFMFNAYSYVALDVQFGTGSSLLPSFNATSVYSLAGFMAASISRPVNYYNDLVFPIPPDTAYTSALMAADVATVTAAPASETANITALVDDAHSTVQSWTNAGLWDAPVSTGVPVTRPYMKNEFFITLNWKFAIEALGIGYPIPPGV
jgi:hypothetical protein